MEDSTLRPTPSYNPNIPVVTSAGGTNVAYKDPNSPEGILKRTTELNAQTAVDTKYDAAASPYTEAFCGCSKRDKLQTLLLITIVVFVTLVSAKNLKFSGKMLLLVLCVLLIIASLRIYHQGT